MQPANPALFAESNRPLYLLSQQVEMQTLTAQLSEFVDVNTHTLPGIVQGEPNRHPLTSVQKLFYRA
jgi:hypothetical protein